MAVNVKMGVDLGGFTSGIKQGQQILKGLNAEMKATDAEFKATGNSEQMLANKTKTLNSQIQVQKGIIDQAQKALKAMTDAGVDPADAAYQRLYATMMNATAGMNNAQAELNALGTSAQGAAAGADQLTTSVNNIGKKISLEQVISGIDRITDGLETAAKKAVQLGETIWNSIMDSAKWADDTMSQAAMFGIDVETFQKMQKLVASGLDTTVESMLRSQQKFKKNIGEGADAFMLSMKDLGLAVEVYGGKTSEAMLQLVTEDQMDLFFRAGQAIMNLGDEYEKEAVAQKLFGKSWRELVPLFTDYKSVEEYTAALDKQRVVEEELVENGADLYDQVGELKENLKTLKDDILLSLAPALTDAAAALNGLLTSVLDYLKTPEGKQMLQDLGTAVSGLFDDLGKIDPEQVVKGFTDVFNTVVGSIQWLVDNKDSVVEALKFIVIGWGALKLSGGALQILNLINGLNGLRGRGGGNTGGTNVTGGTGVGTGFFAGKIKTTVTNAAKVAPFALPALVAIDTIIDTYQQTQEALEKGQASIDKYGAMSELYGGSKEFETWSQLYGYQHIRKGGEGSGEAWEDMDKFAAEWNAWLNDEVTNPLLDAMWEAMTNEQANSFREAMELYSSGGKGMDPEEMQEKIWGPMQEALNVMESVMGPMQVPSELTLPDNMAQMLTEELGTVLVHGKVVLDGEDGNHANGLPYVPYDGYLARLHKGERVVPAREIQSRSYNSNLYVESMYMNNGTDAAGLASAMAAAQQRTMSGYGS